MTSSPDSEDLGTDSPLPSSCSSSSILGSSSYRDENYIYEYQDHAVSCINKMEVMLKNRQLTDVVLKAGPLEIPAHRLVLSASSEYFSIMFTGDMKESTESCITIRNVDPDALRMIVDYCYTGSIEIKEDYVESILSAACLLQFPDIVSACSSFLVKQLHPSNCIGIYTFADVQGCIELKETAESYMAKHFNEVQSSKEFLSLSHSDLAKLLSCEGLNVNSEEDIYFAFMKWLNYDLDNRNKRISSLISLIKLPLLSPSFLVDNVQKEPILQNDPECRALINEATTYHLLPERKPALQSARTRPRLSILDKIYVLGGADVSNQCEVDPSNRGAMSIEMFDISTNKWKEVGYLSNRRLQFGAGMLNGQIHVVGGRDGLKTVNTFECLSKQTQSSDSSDGAWSPKSTEYIWTSLPPMLTHRHGLGVGVVGEDGPLYAVGGHDGWSYLNTTERWNPKLKQWSLIAPMLSSRSTAGVTFLNSKLYAVGGRDGSSCLRTVEMYDPYTNTWYTCASMSKRRAGIGVAALNGCLYVVGGHEGSNRYNCVERYDPREDIWTSVASMHFERDAVSVAVLGDRIVAVGGYDGQSYLSVTEIYDPCNNTWSPLATLKYGRAGACAIPVPRNNLMC